MSHSTDLRKLLIECKELIDADAADALKLGQSSEWEYFRSLSGRIDAALAEKVEPVAWIDGCPPKPWCNEWFIAKTTFGDRVVLTALPEEYTYDFKTADDTYIKADKIVCWMQFPDSQYIAAPADQWRRVENWQPIETALVAASDSGEITQVYKAMIKAAQEAK